MNKDKKTAAMSTSADKKDENGALDRDQPGPVTVSPEDKKKPSYTHNADKTDPLDPHLSGQNKPGHSGQGQKSGAATAEDEEKVLDRDQPGPVSVSPKDKDKPSYTHNADESEPIDPHLADQSGHSKKKD